VLWAGNAGADSYLGRMHHRKLSNAQKSPASSNVDSVSGAQLIGRLHPASVSILLWFRTVFKAANRRNLTPNLLLGTIGLLCDCKQ
jgi:hypothetical protein